MEALTQISNGFTFDKEAFTEEFFEAIDLSGRTRMRRGLRQLRGSEGWRSTEGVKNPFRHRPEVETKPRVERAAMEVDPMAGTADIFVSHYVDDGRSIHSKI